MFPRERRLAKDRDIQRILKSGRRISSPSLLLRTIPNERPYPRVTVVIGATVSKRAVVRNRLKRQLREILRDELKGVEGIDLMLSVRPGVLKSERAELVVLVRQLLRRANITPKKIEKPQ